jgi:hypothetical protein
MGLVILIGMIFLVTAASAAATYSAHVRVAPGPTLVVVGSGFAPRETVRLHVTGKGIDRRAAVRAGARGGFLVRFAGVERCSPTAVAAVGADSRRARVPAAWFIRECPPPPPLQPSASVS